ncbi:MAG: IS630 family transposase [Acidobacteriaceae bacterium]
MTCADSAHRSDRDCARFEVSRVWVYYQVRDRVQATGERNSLRIGGYRQSRLEDSELILRSWIAAEPDPTLAELQLRLAEQGVPIKIGALWHQLNKWNPTFKKTLHASEQEREDVQAARKAWLEAQPGMKAEKLVFIHETWASTSMARRYGRAPKGQRCIGSAPHGDWKTTTFVGALRHDRPTEPMVADEPMDGKMFLAWLQQFLCPTLQPTDIVILDNLSSHKVAGVRQAIEAAGATLLYLPPYLPDLNPIEKLFSKLKALLRKAAKRSVEGLWTEIGALLNTIAPTECSNYFASSGDVRN